MCWEVILLHVLLRKPGKISEFIRAAVRLVRDQKGEYVANFRKRLDEKAMQVENRLWPADSSWRDVLESNKCTVAIQRSVTYRMNKIFVYTHIEPEGDVPLSKLSKLETNHFEILSQLYSVKSGDDRPEWIEGSVNFIYYKDKTYSSVFDLLKLIRNRLEHDGGMPLQFKEALGWYSEDGNLDLNRFLAYWNTHFPGLLSFCWKEFYELNSRFSAALSEFYPKSYDESELKIQIAQLPTQVDKLATLLVHSVNNFENRGNLTGLHSNAVLPVDLIQRLLDGSATLAIHITHENLKCEWGCGLGAEAEAVSSFNSTSENEPTTIFIAIRKWDIVKLTDKRNSSNRFMQITASSEINLLQWAQKLVSKFLDNETRRQIAAAEEKAIVEKVSTLITPNVISDDEFHLVKDTIPPLPSGKYIPRHLFKRVVINPQLFKEKCSDIFGFKCVGRYQLTQLLDGKQTASSCTQIEEISNRFVRLDEDFDWELIRDQAKTPAHLINFNSQDQQFLLEDTTRNSTVLHKYLSRPWNSLKTWQNSISEDEFISEMLASEDNTHKSYIISDSPGMGKTYLLANLARNMAEKCSKRVVVQFIQMNLLFEKLKSEGQCNGESESVNVILEYMCTSQVARSVLMALLTAGVVRLELFLDSLDEVACIHAEFAMKLVQDICSKLPNSRIFISSRTQLRTKLEVTLGVISYNILPLTQTDRINFLVNFWTDFKIKDGDGTRLREFAKICLERFENEVHNDEREMTGIPLQCRLLAVVNANRAKRYCNWKGDSITLEEVVCNLGNSIPQLYKEYIELCWLKCSALPNFGEVKNFHIWHALTVFAPEVSDEFASIFKVNTNSEISATIFSAGLLEKCSTRHGESIEFLHQTLGEYIIAQFFSSLVQEEYQFNNREAESFATNVLAILIKKFLFNEISWQGNLLMSEGCGTMFHSPVIVNFLNFTLRETSWKNERLRTLSSLLMHFSTTEKFFSLLICCLRHNYKNIFCLVTSAISRVESSHRQKFLLFIPKDEVVSGLITAASMHSSVPLIKQLFNFLRNNLAFDTSTAYKKAPATYFDNVVRKMCGFCLIGTGRTNNTWRKQQKTLSLISPLTNAVTKLDYDMVQLLATKMPLEGQNLIACCVENSLGDNMSRVKRRLDICKLLVSMNSKLVEELDDNRLFDKVHLRLVKWLLTNGVDPLQSKYVMNGLLESLLCSRSMEEREEICSILIEKCRLNCSFSSKREVWNDILCYLLRRGVPLTPRTISSILNIPSYRHCRFHQRLRKIYSLADATFQPDSIKDIIMKHFVECETWVRKLIKRKKRIVIVRYKRLGVKRKKPRATTGRKRSIKQRKRRRVIMHVKKFIIKHKIRGAILRYDKVVVKRENQRAIVRYKQVVIKRKKRREILCYNKLVNRRIRISFLEGKPLWKVKAPLATPLDNYNNTWFHIFSSVVGNNTVYHFLVEKFSQHRKFHILFLIKNKHLQLPIHMAAAEFEVTKDTLKIFKSCGVDMSARDADDDSILNYAVKRKQGVNFLKNLIEVGADVQSKDGDGNTLLHNLARSDYSPEDFHEMTQYLIDKGHGRLIETANDHDELPLHCAIFFPSREPLEKTVNLLAGIDIKNDSRRKLNSHKEASTSGILNSITAQGKSPLHLVVISGSRLKLAKQLIGLGADGKIKDDDHRSLAHTAAELGRWDLLKYFVDQGNDVNEKDIYNNNVLQCIFWNKIQWSEEQLLDIIIFLLSKSADKGNVNCRGETAYKLAKDLGISDLRILDALQPYP